MTALLSITSGVAQQFQHGVDEEMINIINSIIIKLTGNPPVNAEHVYHLLQYINTFPHPYRTIRENTGGTLPIPPTVAESLPGRAPMVQEFAQVLLNFEDEVQQQNARLKLDHYSKQREITECHIELEDERKDKQMYQLRWEELKTAKEQLLAGKQQLLIDNQQLLTDKQALQTKFISVLILLLLFLLVVFLFTFLF